MFQYERREREKSKQRKRGEGEKWGDKRGQRGRTEEQKRKGRRSEY